MGLESELGRVAGTPDLGEQGSANAFAGTTGLSTDAALNSAAGYSRGSFRGRLAVLRELAGLPNGGEEACAQALAALGPSEVVLESVTSGDTTSTATTTATIGKPAGLTSGDFILMGISHRTVTTWTTGPVELGFTLLDDIADTGDMEIWYGIYGTSVSSASWDVVRALADKMTWAVMRFSGVDPVTPFHVENGVNEVAGVATTNHATPSIVTTEDAFLVAILGDRGLDPGPWTWPAGWTERADDSAPGTNGVSITAGTKDSNPTAAGTYSVTGTSVLSSTQAFMWIGALKPA